MRLVDRIKKYINNSSAKIKINSKDIHKNDVFIALKGSNYHGNQYINDALNAGCDIILHCSCIIESLKKISKSLPLISYISLSRLTKAFNIIKKPYI